MILSYELILVIIVSFLMALWHKHLIDKDRHIKHGWWAALFAFLIIGVIGWRRSLFPPLMWTTWDFFLVCLIGHQIVFNISLNRLRKLPWDYINPQGKSIIDDLEYSLFGKREWAVEVVLGVIWIILQLWII